ncbi:hypothetical protein OG455_06485 [Kitasatospora sp. NBC_01287]|uniref:hypothetical protein n=1 Tax=Kitasatospora sp. NBC_01287 TaxID=2903573 RepID=UPI0022526976|nr:hypothetical protein [Kitasatospora sp. NBC_01287]MCX4745169.1 hypothetical protein [Kitasatospora sp. NBC_01287]
MKRMPPDPERLEQYQQRLREFAASPPYPLLGLRRPVVVPAYLAQWRREQGEVVSATLAYGDRRESGGPFVTVTTEPPGSAGQPGDPLRLLRDQVGNGTPPAAQGPPVRERVARGELFRLGEAWALRTAVGDQAVTIVGHGPAPEDVEVGPVEDLLPYVTARGELFARIGAERRAVPEPVLPPASGVAAVRAFLETFLPGGPDAGAAYRALGRRAVAELDQVLGRGPRQAEYLVSSMVNQLSQLRVQLPWFTEEDGPRAAALEELLRHYGLRQPVSGQAAMDLWDRYWELADSAEPAAAAPLLAPWAQAWTAWAAERNEAAEGAEGAD